MPSIPEDQLARIKPIFDALEQRFRAIQIPDEADSAMVFHPDEPVKPESR